METTKNDFSPYEKTFFNKMSNYIGEPIYFFGSIQRSYYVPGKSDIDVDIFTLPAFKAVSKNEDNGSFFCFAVLIS